MQEADPPVASERQTFWAEMGRRGSIWADIQPDRLKMPSESLLEPSRPLGTLFLTKLNKKHINAITKTKNILFFLGQNSENGFPRKLDSVRAFSPWPKAMGLRPMALSEFGANRVDNHLYIDCTYQ